MPSKADIARWLAARGMFVFPVRPGSKAPFGNCRRCSAGHCDPRNCACLRADSPCHGLLAATTDQKQIHQWWRCCPQANIAIDTERSQLIVVDLDRKPKPPAPAAPDVATVASDGLAAFAAILAAEGVSQVDTLTIATPSGGRHLYFRCPSGLDVPSDASGLVGHQIDTRAAGGYVLAPGSVLTSGDNSGAYTRISATVDIAALPVWLVPRVLPPPPPANSPSTGEAPNRGAARRGNHSPGYFQGIWNAELSKVEHQDGERWRLVYNAARRLANLATHDTAPWTANQTIESLVAAAVRRRDRTGKPRQEATARRNATRGWHRGASDSPESLLGRTTAR